jgi:hypothetical protein
MRKYPPLKVGDMVKVYQKLEHEQRVYKSRWIGPYEIEKITMKDNLTYYHLEDYPKPLLRHELLNM